MNTRADLFIDSQTVHLWCADLDSEGSRLEDYAVMLSPKERHRAESYRFRRDRDRYVTRRGILRTLLAMYLDRGPCSLEICYGAFGKPSLASSENDMSLQFSLSSAERTALFGFARDVRLGVDLEISERFHLLDDLPEGFLSENEKRTLTSLHSTTRLMAMLICWTRKEALVKAMGYGLSYPLNRLETLPCLPAGLSSLACRSIDGRQWHISDVDITEPYVGAVAVERPCMIEYRQWSPYDFSQAAR